MEIGEGAEGLGRSLEHLYLLFLGSLDETEACGLASQCDVTKSQNVKVYSLLTSSFAMYSSGGNSEISLSSCNTMGAIRCVYVVMA